MFLFDFFKKGKTKTTKVEDYKFVPLTQHEAMELMVGDEVSILDVETNKLTRKVFVKPIYKEGIFSFTSGHFIQVDRYRKSDGSFIVSSNGSLNHIKISKDKSSGVVKGYALTTDLAINLKPGRNVLGMVNETGYHVVNVDVAGQKIFLDDNSVISIEKLSDRGFVKGSKELQNCFFCYDNNTLSDSTAVIPVEKLNKNEVVDVYLTVDNYRAVRCWVKESLSEDGRVVLKYVNFKDMIVLPQKSLSLKLPYVFCRTDTYRVTA
jgi:hypothetical protein